MRMNFAALQDYGGTPIRLSDRVAVTGTLSLPRAEVYDMLRRWGADVCTRVGSHTTTVLICPDRPGHDSGKMRQARRYGVAVLSESVFVAELLRLNPGAVPLPQERALPELLLQDAPGWSS